MSMVWLGDKYGKDVQVELHKRTMKACLLVEGTARTLLGIRGGRTKSGKSTFKAFKFNKRKQTGREVNKRETFLSKINTFRSKPGEPPRTQTGDLKRSMTHEVHPIQPIGKVGPGVIYGRALEFGNPARNLKPRPFLRPALHLSQKWIQQIFDQPMPL